MLPFNKGGFDFAKSRAPGAKIFFFLRKNRKILFTRLIAFGSLQYIGTNRVGRLAGDKAINHFLQPHLFLKPLYRKFFPDLKTGLIGCTRLRKNSFFALLVIKLSRG